MRRSKLLTGILVGAMCMAIATGCGSKTDETVNENVEIVEEVEETVNDDISEDVSSEEEVVEDIAEVEDTLEEEMEEAYVAPVAENPLLKADGKVLRDEAGTGNIVQLKGTNAGGYLLQEFWMTTTKATPNVNAEIDVYSKLIDRFGEEDALKLITLYQDNFWTEADFDYCKSLGMNCIRLPFWYKNIVDENNEIKENWYERFDWFINECAERGIYVILDCHGAPGSQNGSDHSGKDGGNVKQAASEFFFGSEEVVAANQDLYIKIWETVAEHYKDNGWVAGYDLLNEPFCTYRYSSTVSDTVLHNLCWIAYNKAYKKIRAIDPDHVIIMEATWDPVDLPNPTDPGWENVMYEYHNYLYDDYDNAAGQQVVNMQNKLSSIATANYNVPSYMGEFALFNNYEAWDKGLKAINDSGVSWTTWTYKVTFGNVNWGLVTNKNANINIETASYEEIEAAWTAVSESTPNEELSKVVKKYFIKAPVDAN